MPGVTGALSQGALGPEGYGSGMMISCALKHNTPCGPEWCYAGTCGQVVDGLDVTGSLRELVRRSAGDYAFAERSPGPSARSHFSDGIYFI